ncbi:MAG: hypothetical protein WA977_08395 [Halobacteriota archaeon]
MDPRGGNVRLTEKAHELLAKRTEGSGVSMKDTASEAVMLMFQQKRDNRRYALGAFALGALASGCVMFLIGVLW